ncbi:MAG: hypothetical protein K2H29_10255 [Oscillospiraceae bacterium]|nr:hypothetical protein [Oscillospiraceae bacterium]
MPNKKHANHFDNCVFKIFKLFYTINDVYAVAVVVYDCHDVVVEGMACVRNDEAEEVAACVRDDEGVEVDYALKDGLILLKYPYQMIPFK